MEANKIAELILDARRHHIELTREYPSILKLSHDYWFQLQDSYKPMYFDPIYLNESSRFLGMLVETVDQENHIEVE